MLRPCTSLLLLLGSLTGTAHAQLEQHDFDLRVSSVNGSGHPAPYSSLSVNDVIQVSIIVDRSVPGVPMGLQSRDYTDPIAAATATIAGTTIDFMPQSSSVSVTNDEITVFNPVPVLYDASCADTVTVDIASVSTEPDLSFYFDVYVNFGIYYYSGGGCPGYITGGQTIPPSFTQSTFSKNMGLDFGGGTTINARVLSEIVTPLTPALNDDCDKAIVIEDYGYVPFDTSLATTDGSDLAGFCDLGSAADSQIHNDVWFAFRPQFNGCTYISTLEAQHDTKLAIYEAINCPDDPAKVIACSSSVSFPPAANFGAGLDVVLGHNRLYYIRIGGETANDRGPGELLVRYGAGAYTFDNGQQPGAPGCTLGLFTESCFGDGGPQSGCSACPCFNNAPFITRGGCSNSAGGSGRLLQSGSLSVSIPAGSPHDLRFAMSGATPDTFCFLASGASVAPQNAANPCFGMSTGVTFSGYDGLRCAVQDVRRHGPRVSNENGDVGVTTTSWGGANGPGPGIAAQAGFVSGETRHFQVIYRDYIDQGCMTGFNTSQAVTVTFQP